MKEQPNPSVRHGPFGKEFASIVSGSDSPAIAAAKPGIHQSTLYRWMNRYSVSSPKAWKGRGLRFMLGARKPVPSVVLLDVEARVFVATMIGTEGCITCTYNKRQNQTELVLRIDMTDREWVAKYATTVGLSPPPVEGRYHGEHRRRIFTRNPMGLRALRILKEILPYLYGTKRQEASRAIGFFSPTGYVKGIHRPAEIFGDLEGRSKRSDLRPIGGRDLT
ncbi:MAG: hypothetical protein LYZ70_04565 [Nitrososphaerales archaeon]|nr:hypothetical protein [Nitrososphaerales archaeon]